MDCNRNSKSIYVERNKHHFNQFTNLIKIKTIKLDGIQFISFNDKKKSKGRETLYIH